MTTAFVILLTFVIIYTNKNDTQTIAFEADKSSDLNFSDINKYTDFKKIIVE